MPATALIGSRIRERRLVSGLKQSALAQTVGISPAYLNLIEHNKRRIGGKVLAELARALDIDVAQLAEGAEARVIAALRDAAARAPDVPVEVDRIEDFAGQFGGWADLVLDQRRQIAALEHTVETLNDRLAHDPHLAASLHDLLSSVTAINATASILADTDDLGGAWRDRFHRNLAEDSTRLAVGAESLVRYLDETADTELGTSTPQDEVELWFEARGFHLPELERALPASDEALLREAPEIKSTAAKALAGRLMARYRGDAVKMPLAAFGGMAKELAHDPVQLAARFGADPAAAMRRIASLPDNVGEARIGIVSCDGSGTVIFRKAPDGFVLPRIGAACPLWPLFQALNRPMVPIRAVVELAGRDAVRFLVYAIAQPLAGAGFDAPPVYEATMLIVPASRADLPDVPVQRIGSSCRICPRVNCNVRREPSVVTVPT